MLAIARGDGETDEINPTSKVVTPRADLPNGVRDIAPAAMARIFESSVFSQETVTLALKPARKRREFKSLQLFFACQAFCLAGLSSS